MADEAPIEPDAEAAEVPPADVPIPVPFYRWPMVLLRRLYDWTLSWAGTRYATPALFVLAFMEASFFPIPPDVLLMPMCLGKPRRAFLYALICSVGSVSGAVLGYYIGSALWSSMGVFEGCAEYGGGAVLFDYMPGFTCHNFGKVKGLYDENAWLALFTAAFTPIPFKVFTVAAGVFEVSLQTLIFASAVGRSARFFLVSGLIFFLGPRVKDFIEKRFDVLALLFTALLIGGFLLIKVVL